MNKINCLIIDDEPLAVLLLESYAKKSQLFNAIFVSTDVEKGIEILKNEIIEITFLDIQMPILNGFDLMTLFKNKNFILTTAYPNYALDAFKFNVIDYLLKPITFELFIKSLNKYNQLYQKPISQKEIITFKADRKLYVIETNDIIFIEGLKDFVKVHTKSEKIMFLENMKDILLRLPIGKFIRIHRSYIVAVNQIKIIDGNQIILKDGNVFNIGETYRQLIKSQLFLNNF
jgi:two-component system, LytTR family, response regulator